MSTSKGLSTGNLEILEVTTGDEDSRSHHWRLVVDGNVAYHLTHNAGKSRNKSRWVASPWTILQLNYKAIGKVLLCWADS
jgi:hypothetical protein